MISLGDLVVGAALAAATSGSCLAAAWLLVRGRWKGAALGLAFGTAATATLVAAHGLPGIFGVLHPLAALGAALVILLAARRFAGPPHRSAGDGRERIGALAGLALLAVAVSVLAFLRETAGTVVTGLDATTFHVPLDARFIQTGSIWGLHQWLPDYSNATYPANGNLVQVAAILPFDHAFLVTLVAVPYMAMAGLAAYALGREAGAGPRAAAAATAALLALPELADISLATAVTDTPALALIGAGLVFGMRGELRMAGLALGLAAGTKWYGVAYAGILAAVWLIAVRPWPLSAARARLRALPAAIAVGTAAGGFWLVRNWVETGNPVFPVSSPLFGAPRDLIREQAGFTILDYLFDLDVWETYLAPAFGASFGWPGALLAGGALVAVALRPPGKVVALAVAAAALTAGYFATPYSAFGGEGEPVLAGASTRYGLPALLAAAGPAAWAISRGGIAARAVALAAVVAGLAATFSAGVFDLLVAAVVAFGLLGLWRSPRALAVPAIVLVGVVSLVVLRERANDASYTSYSPLYADSSAAWGLAGLWPLSDVSPVLPAFGERLGNDVRYLGSFEDGFLRRHRTRAAFAADLADRDRLLVGCAVACPELDWARAAGWRETGRDGGIVALQRP